MLMPTIQSLIFGKKVVDTMITVKKCLELKTDKEEKCCMAPQMKSITDIFRSV